jgi:hypothetical protein
VGRSDDWYRVAPGSKCAYGSNDYHEQQCADEEVRGNKEGRASVLNSAHVDQGEDEQYGEAERERVGLELREGGDQRSNTRRDPDGGVENM